MHQKKNLCWDCFERRQTKKLTESEFEKLGWIIGHETKSTKIIRPVSGNKLVSGGRWLSGTGGRTKSRRSAWNWA